MSDEQSVVDGRYELKELLGRGGAGRVHRADDLKLGRTVALKTSIAGLKLTSTERQRLKREVEACARVRHRCVVRILDYGEDERLGPYYTMEYVEGRSLRAVLLERNRLPAAEVASLMADVSEALTAIHDAALVHRDLSSGNVLLTDERAMICDFGLILDEYSTKLTDTGSIMGTPAYLAPELLRGQGADERSDIYQIGVLGYEALTGRPPHQVEYLASLFNAILEADILAPSSLVSSVPAAWDELLLSCLQRNPDERPPSAQVLLDRLSAIAELGTKDGQTAEPSISLAAVPPTPSRVSRPIVGLAVLLAAALVLLLWRNSKSDSELVTRRPALNLLSASRQDNGITLRFARTLPEKLSAATVRNDERQPLNVARTDLDGATKVFIAHVSVDDRVELSINDHPFLVGTLLERSVYELVGRLQRSDPTNQILSQGPSFGHRFDEQMDLVLSKSLKDRDVKRERTRTKRKELMLARLKSGLDTEFVNLYCRTLAIEKLAMHWHSVPSALKQQLFEALDCVRRIELLARLEYVHDYQLVERPVISLREPKLLTSPPSRKLLRPIFSPALPFAIGHMRLLPRPSVHHELNHSFTVEAPRLTWWYELLFLGNCAKRLVLRIRLNDKFAGRWLQPEWSKPVIDSQRRDRYWSIWLPGYLFLNGENRLHIQPEVLIGRNVSSEFIISRIYIGRQARIPAL